MAKEIRYPTQEWLDKWVDTYMDEHPTEKISDFAPIYALADEAWWCKEIDANRPTPFDLTAEQEKESKEARRTPGGQGKDRAPVKRERKPNETKRWVMSVVKTLFEGFALNGKCEAVDLSNAERSLDFVVDGKHYTLTLTEHRPPKA